MPETILTLIDESKVNYEADKNIDVHNLHHEWLRQSDLVGSYYKLRAQSENNLDAAKKKVEITKALFDKEKAILELKIRKDPKSFDPGIEKATEGTISALMLINMDKDAACSKAKQDYEKAQEELIEANNKFRMYYAATKMVEERKSSLENTVILWTRNYFSVPDLPRPLIENFPQATIAKRDENTIEMKQALQRTRRGQNE